MANELEKKSQEVVYQSNNEEVRISPAIVKKFLVRGNKTVTDQETFLFMQLCRFKKLNPFLNEAYLVKFGNDAQLIVGKEAFMKKAEANPNYDGFKAGVIIERNNEILEIEGSFILKTDKLLGGWCNTYRKDRSQPFVIKVSLIEYNKNQSTWKTMTSTMIRKTAIVQSLREAFPGDLGGMYTKEDNHVLNQKKAEKIETENKKSAFELATEKKEEAKVEIEPKEAIIIDEDGVIIDDEKPVYEPKKDEKEEDMQKELFPFGDDE